VVCETVEEFSRESAFVVWKDEEAVGREVCALSGRGEGEVIRHALAPGLLGLGTEPASLLALRRYKYGSKLRGEIEMTDTLPVGLMYLTVLAYGVAQVIMLARTSGALRAAAALPLVVMIPAAAMTGYAFSQGSEHWPVLILLLSPVSALYFFALTGITGRKIPAGMR
jgi:hypothetical protein